MNEIIENLDFIKIKIFCSKTNNKNEKTKHTL